MTVASVTSSASPVYLIVGPSRSRTSARPKPRRRPSPRPSAMLRLGLGLNGTGSTGALRTRVALTGLAWLGATRSSWSIAAGNCSPMVSAWLPAGRSRR